MSRSKRMNHPPFVYHVFNRAVRNAQLFESSTDFREFEQLMEASRTRTPMRILAYCLMPTHWHLVLWPHSEGDISRFIAWLCTTHAVRWNKRRGQTGHGAVYQARFKSIRVESDRHLLMVWRYVERNPLTAELVTGAENWRWGSLWGRLHGAQILDPGPLDLPPAWTGFVNSPVTERELQFPRSDL
jgi:putative transposase